MNQVIVILIMSIFTTAAASETIKAKFYTKSADLDAVISYKRVGSSYFGGVFPNSVQCSFACTSEDSCKSFHMVGDDCVFGVDDVTAFEEGLPFTPAPNQVFRIKGKNL